MLPNDPQPRLLLFAPCERVIIGDKDDGTASLIALLQGFNVLKDAQEKALRDAQETAGAQGPTLMMPFRWFLLSLWENDGAGKTYRVRHELRDSSGKMLAEAETDLRFGEGKRFHRISTQFPGFPLTGTGDYLAQVSINVNGEFELRAVYPIPIKPTEKI